MSHREVTSKLKWVSGCSRFFTQHDEVYISFPFFVQVLYSRLEYLKRLMTHAVSVGRHEHHDELVYQHVMMRYLFHCHKNDDHVHSDIFLLHHRLDCCDVNISFECTKSLYKYTSFYFHCDEIHNLLK